MQTTKKSKIFLTLLFLASLLFVSCSFEDTLGTPGRNTNAGENVGSGGGIGGSGENKGASIPKIYHGKYTELSAYTLPILQLVTIIKAII